MASVYYDIISNRVTHCGTFFQSVSFSGSQEPNDHNLNASNNCSGIDNGMKGDCPEETNINQGVDHIYP